MRWLGMAVAALAVALPSAAAGGGAQGSEQGSRQRSSAAREAQPGSASAGASQQERTRQGGAQASQRPGDPQAIARDARSVLAQVDTALSALRRDDSKGAMKALDRASSTLRGLYRHVPAGAVLGEMEKASSAEAPEYAPLAATVRERAVFLDPEVVAGVEEAQEEASEGDEEGAADRLALARNALVADIGLLPLDAAYARIVAARAELEAGRRDIAQRLLRDVPVTIQQVTISAPLVPVRFDLRAAAAAAEEGEWSRAGNLLDRAATRLDRISQAAGQTSPQIDRLSKEVDRLRQQVASNDKPDASAIRQLAARSREDAARAAGSRQARRPEGQPGRRPAPDGGSPEAQGTGSGAGEPPSGGGAGSGAAKGGRSGATGSGATESR